MRLHEWFESQGNTQQFLAERIAEISPEKPITQGAISQWRNEETGEYHIPDRRVLQVEKATGSKVSRYESRPDLYPNEGYAA